MVYTITIGVDCWAYGTYTLTSVNGVVKSVSKFIAIDCETFPIRNGLLVPRLVCGSISDGITKRLLKREDWLKSLWELINSDVNICGHHICFDLAIAVNQDPRLLVPVFKLYEQGRVYDTMVNGKLIDIAEGNHDFCDYKAPDGTIRRLKTKHSLQQYVLRWFHNDLAKGKDTWRLRYGELDGLDVEDYPSEAVRYAEDDALWTHKVNAKQLEYAGAEIPTRILQTKSSWALHLMSVWGVKTNKAKTQALRDHLITERDKALYKLKEVGLVRSDGTKDLNLIRKRVIEAYESKKCTPPLTEKDNISTNREALEASGDSDLVLIAKHTSLDKECGTFLPLLLQATDVPFNPAWNVLVTSGRTSCGSADAVGNLQNIPRSGKTRECFEPRPGFVYCSTDLDTAELRSWAQCCLDLVGISIMAEDIRAGRDPHLAFSADLLEIPYDKAVTNKKDPKIAEGRQLGKVFNFGCPGAMREEALVEYAKGYGVTLSIDKARELYSKWRTRYIEADPYFRFIKSLTGFGNTVYKHHITGFVRGGVTYTELANHNFQHLTATGGKEALYNITRECYIGASEDSEFTFKSPSPLFGSRPVFWIHDECITELLEEKTHDAAYRQAALMVKGADKYITKVPNSCKPALMTSWKKKAEEKFDERGRLVPWEP